MGRFLAGGTGLGFALPWHAGAGEMCRFGRWAGAEEGPRWLPAAGLFLASRVFGPGRWVSLPGWFVLKSFLLLIWQKAGISWPGGSTPVIPRRQMMGEIPKAPKAEVPGSGSCLRFALFGPTNTHFGAARAGRWWDPLGPLLGEGVGVMGHRGAVPGL